MARGLFIQHWDDQSKQWQITTGNGLIVKSAPDRYQSAQQLQQLIEGTLTPNDIDHAAAKTRKFNQLIRGLARARLARRRTTDEGTTPHED